MKVFDSITQTVGRTPLVKMNRVNKGLQATILLKLEFFNPLGSVKDRIGVNMLEQAEHDGLLKPGMEIIEPTSGNTGIALAFAAAAKGYALTLIMPETMSLERRTLLLMLGANVILTPGPLGMRGAIAKTKELAAQNKNAYIPSQFDNPANPDIHRKTTAIEIWDDTDGLVDVVVCGVGTGGSVTGIGEVLKARKSTIEIVAVEPQESAVLSQEPPGPHKIQGIGAGFIPNNVNMNVIDHIEKVNSDDAIATARRIIREEGIPVGISSGAAIEAALRLAQRPTYQGKTIVVIIPSYTERYLSTPLAALERDAAAKLPVASVDEQYL